jgi:transposase
MKEHNKIESAMAQAGEVGEAKRFTIGIDVSDKTSCYCLLDGGGEIGAEGKVRTTPEAFRQQFGGMAGARIALEAGTHSRWMSELLRECGHEVLVANPRRLRLLTESDKKNDPQDARTLAEMAWAKPALLAPIEHRSAEAQADLNLVRARDLLVEARTKLINGVRCLVKGTGQRIGKCPSGQFTSQAQTRMPQQLRGAAAHLLEVIDELSEKIRYYDESLEHMARTRYGQTSVLKQVSGVGTLTALAYMLTIDNPHRFARSRDVGCFLGLRPKQQDSGERSPQLRITKAGDSYLRKMMVSCAHYILGPFGPDTDLRRWGLKLCERGGRNAKKRAVVAVARKLAVLLHHLWVSGEVYEPLRNAAAKAA